MFFGKEFKQLIKTVQKQQDQINGLEKQINGLNEELAFINDEFFFPGKDGYPSLYDVKEKLVEKGWLKKPNI